MSSKRISKKQWKRAIAKNAVLCGRVIEETMNRPSFTSRIFCVDGQEPPPLPPPLKEMTPREFKTAWRKALKHIRLPSKWGLGGSPDKE